MLAANYSTRFKKDIKLVEKRGYAMQKIFDVMVAIQNESKLDERLKAHALIGDYTGYMECHIEPDWLLVYKIDEFAKEVYFARTGTHSDLFS
ncbi:MAG: type II toxin-antitoxin system YafQ family toxin [Coriobacteriia bacterium]|jgi:mRNA interferase YafQ|nr:type II toxin-antitoxin system YafQ family toxin [Coriobacteriia bacterium]MDR2714572.1 type II toxin-antitoxin system YafQ family toxin [Coriobacteriales bacterium]